MHFPLPAPAFSILVRAVAHAGNVVALFAIFLTLANSNLLFTPASRPAPQINKVPTVERVLLVVIDGLRADAVAPDLMPEVHAIAVRGTSTKNHIDALIPSTIAGLRALIEGVTVPPAEFVSDFRSRRASKGGLIEAVSMRGGHVFAAGPYLWNDLYGKWLDKQFTVFGFAQDDPFVLRASREACADPRSQLVITHFSRPDVMAHQYGADSREYKESLAWCDRAIRELARVAGREMLVVITSDHGVTKAGGHAGAEPDVLTTPFITNDPRFSATLDESFPQSDVPYLLSAALGARLQPPQLSTFERKPLSYLFLECSALILACIAVLALLSRCVDSPPPQYGAFWLSISVWICLGIAVISLGAAYITSFSLLLILAIRFRPICIRDLQLPALAIVTGLLLGCFRIVAPWLYTGSNFFTQPSGVFTASVCVGAFGIGYFAGKHTRVSSTFLLIGVGAGIVGITPILTALLGESVSLSTLDVRLAFRFLESSLGLPGAVLAASLRPFLPVLALSAGVVYAWHRAGAKVYNVTLAATGIASVIAGELIFSSIALIFSESQILSALALGLFLRECALLLVMFPALAFAVFLFSRPGKTA